MSEEPFLLAVRAVIGDDQGRCLLLRRSSDRADQGASQGSSATVTCTTSSRCVPTAFAPKSEVEKEIEVQESVLRNESNEKKKPGLTLRLAHMVSACGDHARVVDLLTPHVGIQDGNRCELLLELGYALCRLHRNAPSSVEYGLAWRFLTQLDKTELLICDELGYLSFSRTGAELLFQVFADRYERASLLITSNLAFSDWGQVFRGERMTAALLDRLTHRCHIFEMNGESHRFRESMKSKKAKKSE